MISGAAIYGTVKNQAGSPIAGVTVRLNPERVTGPYFATTNANGYFALAVHANDWYEVSYHDPLGRYYDGFYSGGGLATNGDFPTVNVTTSPKSANATLKTGYHITGHAQTKDGMPLAGLSVVAYTNTPATYYVGDSLTDANGDYSVLVPAGSYWMFEAKDGYAQGCWHQSEPTGDWTTCTTYTVTTADLTLNLTVPPMPAVSGHVTDAQTGLGMGSISVGLIDAYDGTTVKGGQWSAPDGSYSATVQPGLYVVALMDSQGLLGWYGRMGWTTAKSDALVITVPAAGLSNFDFAVPKSGVLHGTVLGNGCNPSNTYIDAYDATGFVTETTVMANGNYTMVVPVGTLWVEFFDANGYCGIGWYAGADSNLVANSAQASSVGVTADTPGVADFTVSPPKWIVGKLTNSSGTAVATTIQVWTGSDFYIQTASASNGVFYAPVLPGSYQLYVVGKGSLAYGWVGSGTLSYSRASASTIAASSSPKTVSVKLPAAPDLITGTLKSAGKVLKGIQIVAYSGNNVAAWARTDTNGAYVLHLRAGTYTLAEEGADTLLSGRYTATGFSPYWADAKKVTASSTTLVANFVVPVGHRVHGIARGAVPAGANGVSVEFFDARGLYDIEGTGRGGIFDYLLPAHDFAVAFYDPSDTWGTAWYSSGGPMRDEADATTVHLGAGDQLDLAITLPPVTVPDAPTGVSGAPFDGGAVVTWTAPANDGWRPITGYTATASPGGATCAASPDDPRCVITGLVDATPYTFTVTATNMKGTGAASTASDPATPNNLPAPPDPVSAAGFHLGALITWTASPGATSYLVTSSPGGLTCSADAPATSCQVLGLTDGTAYTFAVIATGGSGSGPSSGATNGVVPALPNAAVTTLPVTSPATSLLVQWYSSGNNPATYDVRYRRAAWNKAFGAYTAAATGTPEQGITLPVSAGSTYCYSVRAHDLGTVASAWSAEKCAAVPLDDRSLTRSSGWSLLTSASAYRGTYVRTTTLGAKLTRTGVVAKTLTLVATTCPTCGTVKVYWGSTLLKTVSLVSSSTVYRKVILITTFSSARTGTVVIKVATSGKAVLIDGLGVKRQ